MSEKLDYDVRPYRDEDLADVLALLQRSLQGSPIGAWREEFFRWKHLDNPFGRSFMLVADTGERIIGLRAFLRWEFRVGDKKLRAVRAVDTATDPDFQGKGVFSRITTAALDRLREDVDLVFNTPNEKSLPGYLKLGWQEVGQIHPWIRIQRPLRVLGQLMRRRPGETPAESAAVPEAAVVLGELGIDELWQRAPADTNVLRTALSKQYLDWRYCSAPFVPYHAVLDEDVGRAAAVAIFRLRARRGLREATICDIFAEPGSQSIKRVLRRVARSSSADHLTWKLPTYPASRRTALVNRFMPSPLGVTLVTHTLGHDLRPNPTDPSSWALSLGDLELM